MFFGALFVKLYRMIDEEHAIKVINLMLIGLGKDATGSTTEHFALGVLGSHGCPLMA
jgi:hypothetical protein